MSLDLCDFACPHGGWCTWPRGHTATGHRIESCRCALPPVHQGEGMHGRKVADEARRSHGARVQSLLRERGVCGRVTEEGLTASACILPIGHDGNKHEPATSAWAHPAVKAETHAVIAAVADWTSYAALSGRGAMSAQLRADEKALLNAFIALSAACSRAMPMSQHGISAVPACICPDAHPWPGHLAECPRRPPLELPRLIACEHGTAGCDGRGEKHACR